jgi:hypothetical protein
MYQGIRNAYTVLLYFVLIHLIEAIFTTIPSALKIIFKFEQKN